MEPLQTESSAAEEIKKVTDAVDTILANRGINNPDGGPLGIPDCATDENLQRLATECGVVMVAAPCELRDAAMFLMSLCNSLVFENSLLRPKMEEYRRSYHSLLANTIRTNFRGGYLVEKASSLRG